MTWKNRKYIKSKIKINNNQRNPTKILTKTVTDLLTSGQYRHILNHMSNFEKDSENIGGKKGQHL